MARSSATLENSRPSSRKLEEELAIIAEVGYEEYFLVVWDILQECRRAASNGSPVAARRIRWSAIAWASDVCPIRFDLYFRRFLNKERMALHKLPDIDIDFPHDRKDDVVDSSSRRYGS